MPIELSFNERRVLGTLIEKGYTTPEQYPLSLNAVVVGSNQKSCREPMCFLDEEKALDALESLQAKGFAVLVRMAGSRVDRWKHRSGETLTLESKEVAILAELLLRGPQTEGELRQRASRMRPLETLEELERLLDSLATRPDPLIVKLGPPGRARGVKYAHCFYPSSEKPTDDGSDDVPAESSYSAPAPDSMRPAPLTPRPSTSASPSYSYAPPPAVGSGAPSLSGNEVAELKRDIQALKDRVSELEATFVKFLK